jgi:hypothetical protein
MGDVFRVPPNQPELIVLLLASGYALLTGFPAGRVFQYTAAGEIYDVGEQQGPDDANHFVVLIGSGVENYPGNPSETNRVSLASWPRNPSPQPPGPRLFLTGRNSWNHAAHPEGLRIGFGGDFHIWADQIDQERDLWGFYLPIPV